MRDQELGSKDWVNALQSKLHAQRPTSNFKINEPLSRYTTSRLGGPADVLIEVTGNVPPTANAGGNMTVAPGQQVSIQGSGTDSDGTIVQYQWQQLSVHKIG